MSVVLDLSKFVHSKPPETGTFEFTFPDGAKQIYSSSYSDAKNKARAFARQLGVSTVTLVSASK